MTYWQGWLLIGAVGGCAMWLGLICGVLAKMHEAQQSTSLTNAIAKGQLQKRRGFSR